MTVDVAIVGGGPAGCSAALALRSLGRSVTVIDAPGREKPTETSHPGLARLLRSIQAEVALKACEPCLGISSNWGRSGGIVFPSLMSPVGCGWFVHRTSFDEHLKLRAREMGAEWISARATSVTSDSCKEIGIQCSGGRSLHARWMLIACGATSWASRIAGYVMNPIDALVALWVRVDSALEAGLLCLESTEFGWWYTCPANDGSSIVALMTDAESLRSLGLHRPSEWSACLADTTLAAKLKQAALGTHPRGLQVNIGLLPNSSGDRWTAIGDAVLGLDPLGSAGVAMALDSGRRAAFAIANVLEGDPIGLRSYHRWTRNIGASFFQQRDAHYRIEANRRGCHHFWGRRLLAGRPFSTLSPPTSPPNQPVTSPSTRSVATGAQP